MHRPLRGRTRGYRHHPQLERFRGHARPKAAIAAYLAALHAEAVARGYAFDRSKIGPLSFVEPLPVAAGQVAHEWAHLLAKLATRDPPRWRRFRGIRSPAVHSLFRVVPGPVEGWERA